VLLFCRFWSNCEIPAWAGPLILFLNKFPFNKMEENRFGGRAQGKVALQNLVRGGMFLYWFKFYLYVLILFIYLFILFIVSVLLV
jgi:hypothetical protein